jgi:ATP-dependent Clp protease adaptor protein ClpS
MVQFTIESNLFEKRGKMMKTIAEKAIIKETTKTLLERPPLHKVVLLNDDYTTMDFVIRVLIEVFHKSIIDATQIMLDVHQKGKGIVGVYPYDIAYSKVLQVERLAEKEQFPLMAVIEQ